ncbi:TPA: FAD/NAD(P)-binding protein, partial [Legionella pneumophila]|nr:FAD/NAD(P)-binding protein [Legionella pneumophila]
MKDFVIVGAGPIGLYCAARLAQIKESSGLPINIVVIDPRAGNYNRERIVSNEAIKSISSRFSISMPSGKGIPSEAMYIRDFEKSLYEYCESRG